MRIKDPVSGISHLVGFVAAIIGLVILILRSYGNLSSLITMVIYGSSLVLLYGASSIYHLLNTSDKQAILLRKADHTSIFILIAGCYTPVFYHALDGYWQIVMLTLVWVFCLAGVILKSAWINVPRLVSTALYVIMGWLAVVPFYQLTQNLPLQAILLMIGGGIFYTIGAVIYATKKLNPFPPLVGFHEVFHFLVLAGSITHYVLMLKYIVPLR